MWPVSSASTKATRKPDAFVHIIDSCIVGGRFGPAASGLSAFVATFTLSCSPPVTASISSETPMSARPYGESSRRPSSLAAKVEDARRRG